ncbi:MAG: heme NO-binding domain-containing protein [Oligoflexia bacterium]|nr:heme NO-binding domain-containing protein [Oligoflexia bacterium]
MKGEVFNLLEQYLVEHAGPELCEQIHAKAAPELEYKGPHIGPGTYEDRDFFTILKETVSALGISADAAALAFGKYCFPKLAARFGDRMRDYHNTREFLLVIQDVIHVEVKKLMSGARPPNFYYVDQTEDSLTMIYDSERNLHCFAEGLFYGCAAYFGETIEVKKELLAYQGRKCCIFTLTFGRP